MCAHAASSVLDYRPSTVAAAAILAASCGALLTQEALEAEMGYLSPSCIIEKVSSLHRFVSQSHASY